MSNLQISLKNNSKSNKSTYLSCLGGKEKFKPLDKSAFSLSLNEAIQGFYMAYAKYIRP